MNLVTHTKGFNVRNGENCNRDEHDTLGQMRQRMEQRDKAKERLTHRPVQETRERRDQLSHLSVLSISVSDIPSYR